MRRRRAAPVPTPQLGWRVHLVVPVDVEGVGQFIASTTRELPSLPGIGTVVAITGETRLRPDVEHVTCWLDGYAGLRLSPVTVSEIAVLDELERDGWRIETGSDVDTGLNALLGPGGC